MKESFLWATQTVLSSWTVKGIVGTPGVFSLRFPVMSRKRCYGRRKDAVGDIIVVRRSQLWKSMF